MITKNGLQILKEFSQLNQSKSIYSVGDGVHFFVGYGTSNAIAIEAEMSVILVDTLDSPDRSAELLIDLQKITPKPIRTIIYTTNHEDHRGGASMFRATAQSIISFGSNETQNNSEKSIKNLLNKRQEKFMGYNLSDEMFVTQGLGKREGHTQGQRNYQPLLTTEVITTGIVDKEIDGVHLQLINAPGESNQAGYVWLPEQKIMCCGDNFYQAFPDLTIVNSKMTSDVTKWIKSLDLLISFNPQTVLPGHLNYLDGKKEVKVVLNNYKEAMLFVFNETLKRIDMGNSIETIINEVELPESLVNLPYLQEIYGSVEWNVRAIYSVYIGWFNGNPTNLHKLSLKNQAVKMVKLIGDNNKVLTAIKDAINMRDYLWALQLCDLLIELDVKEANQLKIDTLYLLADMETSALGRNYYLSCALELKKVL